jgi:iron complex outermembrane receptor protein
MAIDNVLNEDYAERADFAFGSERFFPGRGRAFQFGVSARF